MVGGPPGCGVDPYKSRVHDRRRAEYTTFSPSPLSLVFVCLLAIRAMDSDSAQPSLDQVAASPPLGP
jgi:hypothetical protein